MSPEVGSGKHHVFIEDETNHKTQGSRHKKRSHMGFEGIKAEINHRSVKQKMIPNEVNQQSEHRVPSAAGGIAERMQGHEAPEGRIKQIDEAGDKLFHAGRKSR